jgi:hypothetical protein
MTDPVLDPVGAVVGLVTAADPALGEGTVRQAAERVSAPPAPITLATRPGIGIIRASA